MDVNHAHINRQHDPRNPSFLPSYHFPKLWPILTPQADSTALYTATRVQQFKSPLAHSCQTSHTTQNNINPKMGLFSRCFRKADRKQDSETRNAQPVITTSHQSHHPTQSHQSNRTTPSTWNYPPLKCNYPPSDMTWSSPINWSKNPTTSSASTTPSKKRAPLPQRGGAHSDPPLYRQKPRLSHVRTQHATEPGDYKPRYRVKRREMLTTFS